MAGKYLSKAAQCTAKSRQTGERCRRPAIAGGAVCRFHGGSAPQVKQAAEKRLREMVNPALKELSKLLTGAKSEDVRFRAVREILERAGVGRQEIEAAQEQGYQLVDMLVLLQHARQRVRGAPPDE